MYIFSGPPANNYGLICDAKQWKRCVLSITVFAVKKEEMDPFFTQLNGKWGWDTVYTPSAEEKEELSGANAVLTALATLLMLSPFIFLAKVIIMR